MFRILAALDVWDRWLFDRLTRRERRVIDSGLKRLSNSANRSVLWLAIAVLIAILTGLNSYYFSQPFGTLKDYVGLFLWAAGTKATLDILGAVLDKLAPLRTPTASSAA